MDSLSKEGFTPQQIIENERLVFDVRRYLEGNYDREGLAMDKKSILETISQYQLAIDAIDMYTQKNVGVISVMGVGGSMANNKMRLGVFDPTDFSRTYDRVEDLICFRTLLRFKLPSDIDVIVNSDSEEEALSELSRKIYRTTGVFIDFIKEILTERENGPRLVPFSSLVNGGVVGFLQTNQTDV